ncbi:hypothetical protein FKM82_027605, partial [Ascaphus truei]
DRKAVISRGTIKCIGSSLFLKSKWGVGYRLSMDIETSCDVDALSALISEHVEGASLTRQLEQSLLYALPLRHIDKFSGLFSALDNHSSLGVIQYGVSMTTLEDVFLKLEAEADIDQADHSIFSRQRVEEDAERKSMDDVEQSLLMLPELDSSSVGGPALWKQQVATIAKIHFRNLQRDSRSVRDV